MDCTHRVSPLLLHHGLHASLDSPSTARRGPAFVKRAWALVVDDRVGRCPEGNALFQPCLRRGPRLAPSLQPPCTGLTFGAPTVQQHALAASRNNVATHAVWEKQLERQGSGGATRMHNIAYASRCSWLPVQRAEHTGGLSLCAPCCVHTQRVESPVHQGSRTELSASNRRFGRLPIRYVRPPPPGLQYS